MARPVYNFEPKIPKQDSPIGKGSQCGSSWHSRVEVRAPYKSTDKYVNALPLISERMEATSPNLDKSLPILLSNEFKLELDKAIDGAMEIFTSYKDDGYLDKKNKDTIAELIDRSKSYFNKAKALQNYWDNEYNSDPGKGPPGWPLINKYYGHECNGKVAPEKGSFLTMSPGAKVVEFVCPTQQIKDFHTQDRETFRDLMVAALLNCRCAQEAAAAVGTFNRNKESHTAGPQSSAGMAMAKSKPKRKPLMAKRVIPQEEEEEKVETSPKKKDNTIALVAVAGLGLLLLKK